MLIDGHAIGFDINIWKNKVAKKLTANADYYLIKTLCMAYVNSRVDSNAYKHLAARFRVRACKPFTMAGKMLKSYKRHIKIAIMHTWLQTSFVI